VTTASASERIVIDSSGWLEYLTADTKAELFAPYVEGKAAVFVPVIVLYEVRKILLLRQLKPLADVFVSEALKRTVIPIDEDIALTAAALSIQHQLAMADAFLYAAAQSRMAEFVTSDKHFQGLPGVTLL
jgi:predicted nucleic acid-binding protein